MAYRTGPTPDPDASWTPFVTVAASGGAMNVSARYIQYHALLATSDLTQTPVLQDVEFSCCADATPPAAIADLATQRLTLDSNSDGTRQIRLTFTPPADAVLVEIYRASFGNYPEYDDPPNAGSVPAVPTYPPDASRWSLTSVTTSGQTDEPALRDEYDYVAFSKDACGNVSAVSNRAGGTINYVLGDVHDGQPGHDCTANNVVYVEDLSLLGAHYGLTLASGDPYACLDVGPTVTGATDARPLTDNVLDFEDLIVFGINFSASPLVATPRPAGPSRQQAVTTDAVWLEAPASVQAGEEFVVRLWLDGQGGVRGLSAQLAWDHAMAEPVAVAAGDLAMGSDAIVLGRGAGGVDAVRLAAGFSGRGVLAEVRFRSLASGAPIVRTSSLIARDAANQNVPLGGALATPVRELPLRTQLGIVAPNPFRSRLAIQLAIGHAQHVRLRVYDLGGRLVRGLVDGDEVPGRRLVVWDGRDQQGRIAAAGVYVLSLEAGEVQQHRRVQLLH